MYTYAQTHTDNYGWVDFTLRLQGWLSVREHVIIIHHIDIHIIILIDYGRNISSNLTYSSCNYGYLL